MIPFLPILARLLPLLAGGEGALGAGGLRAILGRAVAAETPAVEAGGVAEGLAEKAVKPKPLFRRVTEAIRTPEPETGKPASRLSRVVDAVMNRPQPAPRRERREPEPGRRYGPSVAEATFATAEPDTIIGKAQQFHQERREQKRQEEEAAKTLTLGKAATKVAMSLTVMGLKSGGMVGAFYGVTRSLEGFANTIAESKRELSDWNGRIAFSFAGLDFQRQMRRMQAGEAQEGTTVALNDAINELEEQFLPMKNALGNLENIVGVVAAKVGTIGLHAARLVGIQAAIEFIAQKLGMMVDDGKKPDEYPLRSVLNMLMNGAPGPAGPRMPPLPLPPAHGPRAPLPPVR